MEKQISSGLRYTFLVHCIIAGLLGLSLWIIPGRTLTVFGLIQEWIELPTSGISIPGGAFVNPFMTRLFGAALLALAFSSFKGWRAKEWPEVKTLVQMGLVFCILGVISALYYLSHVDAPMWIFGGISVAFLVSFAIAWGLALQRHTAQKMGENRAV
jgi:hypothetical protein